MERERRGRKHDFLLRDASRDTYTKRRHAREKSPPLEAIDRYRVTNESRSKRTISLSRSLFFFRAERVSPREYKY